MKLSVSGQPLCRYIYALLMIAASSSAVGAGADLLPQQEAAPPAVAERKTNFGTMVGRMVDSKQYRTVLEKFVAHAADGNLPALTALISSSVTQTVGDEEIAKSLRETIIPFFSDYETLHNVSATNPAIDARGNQKGYWFYTYIKTTSGKVRPFSMSVIDDAGALKVVDVVVGQCRADRHPFCP